MRFDIVLYGATGFTGGLVAEYLARQAQAAPLRWALAGRSQAKLEAVRERLTAAGLTQNAPELVIAEASDADSLARMAKGTRVVITTVGPYIKYGESLVRACAEAGTDYVDLTGEPLFVAHMIERYHELAAQRGARIVHACGFDSIPHDLGAYFTLQALRARMSEAERASAAVTIEGFVRARGTFSGGTLHSALEIMPLTWQHEREQAERRKQRPASQRNAQAIRAVPKYRSDAQLWAVPLPTIDPEIVVRSAEFLPEYGPDFRYGHYIGLKHGYQVAGIVAGAGALFTLAQLPPARALLRMIKDPGEGPDEATRAKSYFRVLFLGRAGEHEVRCEVKGGDPGYGETAKMLAESALCLAFDRDKLPPHTGVVTSAAAMGNPLIERLQRAGISFREVS